MTVVIVVLAIVVALLVLLVAGLLRSHAEILRRLEALGAGEGAASRTTPKTAPGVPGPPDVPAGRAAADVSGATLAGGARALRVAGVPGDTLLLFLSSGCLTCRAFWQAAAAPAALQLPAGTRLVVVAKDLDEESPSALAELAGPATELVLSTSAWRSYGVPGSPYAVLVDGPAGRVRGEGTGADLDQVARLLAQATGDLAWVGEAAPAARRGAAAKARSDAARERDTDAELLAAGIVPGDPSLYPGSQGDLAATRSRRRRPDGEERAG